MRSEHEYKAVRELIEGGLSASEIARRTGIPRSTVRRWRGRPYRPGMARLRPAPRDWRILPRDWRPPEAWPYCYLLGLYLGDGHVVVPANGSASLRLYLDQRYALLIAEAKSAMGRTAPRAVVRSFQKPGCVVVCATDPAWPVAFPQHGPGKKYTRAIRLTAWQQELTERHPKAFLRGLIHPDGCRTINRFTVELPNGDREYAYPRYFFSNLSDDMRALFCAHCDLLGIKWTRSRYRDISISSRKSVALLDSFIGPKG